MSQAPIGAPPTDRLPCDCAFDFFFDFFLDFFPDRNPDLFLDLYFDFFLDPDPDPDPVYLHPSRRGPYPCRNLSCAAGA